MINKNQVPVCGWTNVLLAFVVKAFSLKAKLPQQLLIGVITGLCLFGLIGTANAAKSATITKTLQTAPPSSIGDTVTWQITVTNTGDETIENVEVTDVLGAGFEFGSASESGSNTGQTTIWTSAEYAALASMDAGESLSMEITAEVIATVNLENRADVRFGLNPRPLPAEFDSAVDGGTAIVVYSVIAPRVSSITRQNPSSSPTAQDTVTWRVTFSEGVKNVDPTDFSVAGTTATVSSVSTVSANEYNVTISGGDLADLDGTVTLSFAGGQNIQDLYATALTNTTPTGTNNNTFLMQQDMVSPAVEILNAPSIVANQDPFNVTFEFSEDVTGFVVGDITVANGNASNFITTDGNTYTADITPTGAGNLTIDINAGVAEDGATNPNTAATQVQVTYDSDSPAVEILNAPSIVANQDPFNVTFEFSEDVTGFVVGDISVANGNASNFGTTDANTYTADITPTGAGDLTIDINAGVAQDAATNTNTAATQVLVTCGPGCGESATIARTQQVLQNFAGKRIRQITAQGPELSNLLINSDMGGSINGFFATPFNLNFNGDESSNLGNFSASLQQFSNHYSSPRNDSDWYPVDFENPSSANIWIKGRWTKVSDDRGDIDEESDFGIIYLGADYRFTDDLLIGLLGQYDWLESSSKGMGSQAEGDGWMVGPYLVYRLKDTLIMDVRVAWGQSDNKINPIGTYWDNYDSERWQLEGNLSGNFTEGNWHITPALGFNYFEDTQESYIDSNGFTIPGQSVELGTLSFGPKIVYMVNSYDGLKMHPFMTVKGLWDFKAPDIFDINGISSSTEELRAQVDLGISILTDQGINVKASYTHDGIGIDDYESHSAELSTIVFLKGNRYPKGSSISASYSLQNIPNLMVENSQTGKVQLNIPLN
ncbi:MAG: autotransporter domain-containing protein [Desulfobulbaceae bacterium]|nr:autotransporter domain-containing protein [Desulfobulbaceae bacterium]